MWSSLTRLDWRATQHRGSSCLPRPLHNTEIIGVDLHAQLFTRGLGIQSQVLCMPTKCGTS